MKVVSISGSLRENVGKKDAKALRRAEMVPCVMYGGKEQIHFATEVKNFKKILFTPECFIINIKIDGKSYDTIIQDVQYHPVTDDILHADFLFINEDKPITVILPVVLEGQAPGVLRGGKLNHCMRKVKVSGMAKDLPDSIVIDIRGLNMGDTIKAKDLDIKGVTMLCAPTSVVVDVRVPRGNAEETTEEAAPAEGAAAPAAPAAN